VIAGALEPIQKEFGFYHTASSSIYSSILQGALILGATVGSLGGSTIANLVGRRIAVLVLSTLSLIGAVISTASVDYWMLVASRAILGIGMGMTACTCPLYVSEMSTPKIRGMLGSLFQLAITFGIFLSYVAGIALMEVPVGNWRYMLGLGALPALGLGITGIAMPESPYWKESKALAKAAKAEATANNQTTQHKGQLREMFRKQSIKPLSIGFLLAVVLQLTGINAIMYYAPTIFAGMFPGSDARTALIITVFIGLWNFLTTIVAVFLVDRLGRRKLYTTGLALMTASTIVLGFVFFFVQAGSLQQGIVAVCMIATFILGFEIGPGPLFFVLCTELFPARIRDSGNSLMNVVNWAFTFLVTVAFLPLAEAVGQAVVFWIFGGIGLVTWFMVLFVLPETKGRSISAAEDTAVAQPEPSVVLENSNEIEITTTSVTVGAAKDEEVKSAEGARDRSAISVV